MSREPQKAVVSLHGLHALSQRAWDLLAHSAKVATHAGDTARLISAAKLAWQDPHLQPGAHATGRWSGLRRLRPLQGAA